MVVFSKVTAAAAALAAVASAAPTKPVGATPRLGFTVNQIAKPVAPKSINLPGVYANAIHKYGGTVPQHVREAATKGSAVTTPEANDQAYLTPVTAGASTVHLDIDTGSADLWVFSNQLSSSESSGHDVYKPSSNATKMSGYTWSISYGDGSSASGDVYKDSVTVGGVTAPSQAVEAALKVSSEFTQDKDNDGLLGLAFSSINTVKPKSQTTFFDTVKSELDAPLFAVTLKHNAPGSYDFGYIDNSKYTGKIAYTDVDNSQGFWGFTADGYTVGNGQASSDQINGIADTGTTLLMLPTEVVEAYYKEVDSAQNSQQYGGYVFPCSTSLPDFTVAIGDYNAVVSGDLINYAPVTDGSSTCFGGIQDNSDIGMSIFGDIFLKSQYVVFSADGPKLGFAPQA
ncbi:aspartic endopeptidase Pep1/aspergillopepsin F [Paecilomyces variotii No. 5]|uniref:Aspartic endopeptidase Pep1/aspergillopepsin F n=1 Tax=Byssochlamys spectabilis (strain No. 5 / NBRC 109023) TaxID=1356009 RepID=V5FA51_BYSSN|nr:aspartic endopeptidase Pep1/aspergillopepsin F [Paecilomyces variotii No. 5]